MSFPPVLNRPAVRPREGAKSSAMICAKCGDFQSYQDRELCEDCLALATFPPELWDTCPTGLALIEKGRRVRLQMRDILEAYPELCCEAVRQLPSSGGSPARCEEEWTRTVQHEGRARKVCFRHDVAYRNPMRALPVEFI